MYGKLFGNDTEYSFGLQGRDDWIEVRLDHVTNRVAWQHVSTNQVNELDIAPWVRNRTRWTDYFRTEAGIRADGYYFGDSSDYTGNSGNTTAGAVSPKVSLVFGPWSKTEYYLQGGLGFRTNDVRGMFTAIQPNTGQPSLLQTPIVHSRGAEVGVRSSAIAKLNTTLSVWTLNNDSDTFFDGDAGALVNTDRPSLRTGVEWTNFYSPISWLTVDADFAYSWAYFIDGQPGIWVPEAVRAVVSGAVTVKGIPGMGGLFGSLRWRYFGPRPLTMDNSQQSASVAVLNLLAGYEFNKTWTLSLAVLNLFNAQYNDAEYYDSSRLKGEPPGPNPDGSYSDHMVHAGDPLSARLTLTASF